MRKLTELSTDSDFEEFSTILSKLHDSHAVITMKQAVQRKDGEYNYVDLQQTVTENRTTVQINGQFVFITLHNSRRPSSQKARTMWNTVLQRGTNQFKKGEANDYIFVLDMCRSELDKGTAYCLSAFQPIFMSGEGDSDLSFVFSLESVACGIESVSMYDIEYELENEEESSINTDADEGDYSDEPDDADENYDANDDFLNTDMFTNPQ